MWHHGNYKEEDCLSYASSECKIFMEKTGDPQVDSLENMFSGIKEVTCKRKK